MRAISTLSLDPEAEAAAADILSALAELAQPPQAFLVFAAGIAARPLLAALAARYPGIPVVGCTVYGVGTRDGFAPIALLAVSLYTSARVVAGVVPSEALRAGRYTPLAESLAGLQQPCRLAFAFADGLSQSGDLALAALRAHLSDVPIIGGLAADPWEFRQVAQFAGQDEHTDALSFLLIGDEPILCGQAIGIGWDAFARTAEVTAVEGHRVLQIGDEPALHFYRVHPDEDRQFLGEYPLLVEHEGGRFLRAPLRTCPEEQSVEFIAEVPRGARVAVASGNSESILAATREALVTAGRIQPAPDVTFAVNCAARAELLGARVQEDLRHCVALLPFHSELVGIYLYGEFGPTTSPGSGLQLHNETIVLTMVGPDFSS